MNTMKSPTSVDDRDEYWLLEGLKKSSERLDEYIEKNNVLHPEDMDESDLPQSENEEIEKIDKEALDTGYLSGRWRVNVPVHEIDGLWEKVRELVATYEIWGAQVTTTWGRKRSGDKKHSLMIYTPNYFDEDDVFRVRELLREECDIDRTIKYKPDIYNMLHINKFNAESLGLPGQNRYEE